MNKRIQSCCKAERPIANPSSILVSSAVALAIVGATQHSLAQTTLPTPQEATQGPSAPAKSADDSLDNDLSTEPAHGQGTGTEQLQTDPAQLPGTTPNVAARSAPPPAPPLPAPPPPPSATAPVATTPSAAQASEVPESASWFARTPISTTFGIGSKRVMVAFYGIVGASAIHDSTRSYDEAMGSALVARHDTYAGRTGRTQFTPRGTRLGLQLKTPEIGGVRTTGVLTYGIGPQSNNPPATTEGRYYDTPTLGLNQAYVNLQNDYVDVLGGLTYGLFGWQNYYYPCSVEFFGLPNQTFSRTTQVRLTHLFGEETGPLSAEVAVAAMRPAQRDSEIPDTNAGVRLAVNGWKGISTPGSSKTMALPLSVGVSGVMRQFKVNAFAPPPAQSSNSLKGWGLSLDGFIPVIPAKNENDRSNRLTLTGSFVKGTGIGDLTNSRGGAMFPTLPNPALAQPPPVYTGNIDSGLVTFDIAGVLHTIDWQTFVIGFQYYLPPTGRLFLAGNVTHSDSKNIAKLYPRGGTEVGLLTYIAHRSDYYDINLFWDATPAVRLGASLQYTTVEYLDGQKPHNVREMLQVLYTWGADPLYPL
jgi:hypothetical protein